MSSLDHKMDVLMGVFRELAHDHDVSLQMNMERGGLLVQVSVLEASASEVIRLVSLSSFASQLDITEGQYATIVHWKGDRIDVG